MGQTLNTNYISYILSTQLANGMIKPQLHFQRYEVKYYISESLCSELIGMINSHMTLDQHLKQKGKESYLVRSLYLDTKDLKFYFEKLAGIRDREKFRIRAYDEDRSNIFLEIKKKYNKVVLKDRVCIDYNELPAILDRFSSYQLNGKKSDEEKDTIIRFISFIKVVQIQPTILIAYDRQAYTSIFDSDVRLTLDRNLRCLPGRSVDLFYSGKNWISVDKPCILELKFNNAMPFFFKSIIKRFNLRAQGISKYCLCIERSKQLLL